MSNCTLRLGVGLQTVDFGLRTAELDLRTSRLRNLPTLHRQHAAIGCLRRDEHATLRAVSKRTVGDGDLVSGLQAGSRPAAASEVIRTHALEPPRINAA